MIDKDPTVIDYHWEFYTQLSFVPYKICLEWKSHESFLSLGSEEGIGVCLPSLQGGWVRGGLELLSGHLQILNSCHRYWFAEIKNACQIAWLGTVLP